MPSTDSVLNPDETVPPAEIFPLLAAQLETSWCESVCLRTALVRTLVRFQSETSHHRTSTVSANTAAQGIGKAMPVRRNCNDAKVQ